MEQTKYKLSAAEHEAVFSHLERRLFKGKSPVSAPKAVILGGQPGAGKSKLTEIMLHKIFGGPSNVVQINGDDYREDHPQIEQIGADNDKLLAEYTDPDVRDWTKRLFDKAIADKYNIVFEGTLRNPAPIMETMKRMADLGYEIHVACMAVRPEISKISTFVRYESQKSNKGFGRWTNPAAHDVTVEHLPNSLDLVERESPIASLYLYNRDGACLYQSEEGQPARAKEVLLAEWNRTLSKEEEQQIADSTNHVLNFMLKRKISYNEFREIRPHLPHDVSIMDILVARDKAKPAKRLNNDKGQIIFIDEEKNVCYLKDTSWNFWKYPLSVLERPVHLDEYVAFAWPKTKDIVKVESKTKEQILDASHGRV